MHCQPGWLPLANKSKQLQASVPVAALRKHERQRREINSGDESSECCYTERLWGPVLCKSD
jgi:hypothetical protein